MQARVDYGNLRLQAGETEKGETLYIGLFGDTRRGLESFADGVASYYNVKLRPLPTAYCTWYHARASDEKRLAKNTDFAAENLKNFGLGVMQIDDGWQLGTSSNGPKKYFLAHDPNGPYASGMKATADYIKSRGMTPGIWFMPFTGTWTDPLFANKQELFYKVGDGFPGVTSDVAKKDDVQITDLANTPYASFWGGTSFDLTNPVTQDYVRQMTEQIVRDWGYEYLKMDGFYTGLGTKHLYVSDAYVEDDLGKTWRHDPAITPVESYRIGMKILREAATEDTFFLGCCMVQSTRCFGPAMGGLDAMRVGPDNAADVKKLATGPTYATRYYFLNKRVWHNDPDPMYFRTSIPTDATKLLATWVTLSGTLGASSYDYDKLPADRLDMLKRTMPSHTLKASRPVDFWQNDNSQQWLLTDDSSGVKRTVLGHYNWDHEATETITTNLADLDLEPSQTYVGFDYWNNKFLPPFTGQIESTLKPLSCRDLAIYTAKDHPQVVSTSRHITQGVIDIERETWDKGRLNLTCQLTANDPYEIRLAVPAGDLSWRLDGVLASGDTELTKSFTQDGTQIRVQLNSSANRKVQLMLKFSPTSQ